MAADGGEAHGFAPRTAEGLQAAKINGDAYRLLPVVRAPLLAKRVADLSQRHTALHG